MSFSTKLTGQLDFPPWPCTFAKLCTWNRHDITPWEGYFMWHSMNAYAYIWCFCRQYLRSAKCRQMVVVRHCSSKFGHWTFSWEGYFLWHSMNAYIWCFYRQYLLSANCRQMVVVRHRCSKFGHWTFSAMGPLLKISVVTNAEHRQFQISIKNLPVRSATGHVVH